MKAELVYQAMVNEAESEIDCLLALLDHHIVTFDLVK